MTCTFGKDIAKIARKKEVELREKLATAQLALEGAPQSPLLQATVTEAETLM